MTTLQLTRYAALMQPPVRINYAGTAKVWRETAQKAQEAGDFEAMRQSHFRALENEMLAKTREEAR